LTGISGVHYVAAWLSHLGFHAVPTTRNAKGPDLLVSTIDGARSAAIQVKTTNWAVRWRGRGHAKCEHHYEWDIGWSSARQNHSGLLFALVDLKNWDEGTRPDVFIVPSSVIYRYFEHGDPTTWRRARLHIEIAELADYKNKADALSQALNGSPPRRK
jgi:hypothetical protein